METRFIAIVLTIFSLVVIIMTSFTKPIESDYERCVRVENEISEQIHNTKGEGIQKYFIDRKNDGRIEVTIWALKGFGADQYHLKQHTWFDSYGTTIETITWRENFVAHETIIDFEKES